MFSNSFNHSISSSSSVNKSKNDAFAKFKRFLFKEKSKSVRNPGDLKLYSDYCSDSLIRSKHNHDHAFDRRGETKTNFRSLRMPKSKTRPDLFLKTSNCDYLKNSQTLQNLQSTPTRTFPTKTRITNSLTSTSISTNESFNPLPSIETLKKLPQITSPIITQASNCSSGYFSKDGPWQSTRNLTLSIDTKIENNSGAFQLVSRYYSDIQATFAFLLKIIKENHENNYLDIADHLIDHTSKFLDQHNSVIQSYNRYFSNRKYESCLLNSIDRLKSCIHSSLAVIICTLDNHILTKQLKISRKRHASKQFGAVGDIDDSINEFILNVTGLYQHTKDVYNSLNSFI